MKHKVFDYPDSTYFIDTQDPSDPEFRLINMRLPYDPRQTPYGPFEYKGIECRDRLVRFCAAYLAGFGYLTQREVDKIVRKHPRRN